MPIHESRPKRRDRWPLEFDLEGVPRNTAERERLLQQQRMLSQTESSMPKVTNSPNMFAVDYANQEHVVDINNPPKQRVPFQEFPKMVYHHDTGRVLEVKDREQEQVALKHGYQRVPSPNHDYSQIQGGIAKRSEKVPKPPADMSAEELMALDQQDTASEPAAAEEPPAEEQQADESQSQLSPRRRNR